MIHIEADIHATEGNKNGCPKDEFIPYLKVRYTIVPQGEAAKSLEPIRGDLMPMVARDGWHYGASVPMPRAGRYKLTYTLEPPTAAGRHSDPATGVDPWWKPFEVSFDWDYPGTALTYISISGTYRRRFSHSTSASRAGSGNSSSGLELIASETPPGRGSPGSARTARRASAGASRRGPGGASHRRPARSARG